MKKIIQFLLLAGMLLVLGACSSDTADCEALGLSQPEDRAQVELDLLVPLSDLPSSGSRVITDDSSIQTDPQSKVGNYTILVFNQDYFVEAIHPGDTYTDENQQVQPKIVYDLTNGGRMKIALDKTMNQVRLMMVANHKISSATMGKFTASTSWDNAVAYLQAEPFTYTGKQSDDYMPMYGHSGTGYFQVKQGMVGLIQLQRCMARVVLDCQDAFDHFKLESIFVYNANQTGYLAPKTVIDTHPVRTPGTDVSQPGNNPARFIQGQVDEVNNIGFVYLPELTGLYLGKNEYAANTSVIFKGTYSLPKANPYEETRTEVRYYRLEFIRRNLSSGSIQYEHLSELRRNTSYVFQIDYLVDKNSVTDKNNILDKPAANLITGDDLKVFTFTDAGIRDITTDNLTYLGVTDSKVMAEATADGRYYCVNIRVITNNPQGFSVQTLPQGCTTNYIPDGGSWNEATAPSTGSQTPQVHSIWFFFNRSVYDPAPNVAEDPTRTETLYFYAGNIRKSVTVYSPYAIGF